MWLRPFLVPVARRVVGSYYRVDIAGDRVPARGPVLVVANHPNMLFDALLATAAADRPLRFIAKSTLFRVPVLRHVMHAIGALPVYRRRDAAIAAGSNGDALSAVVRALRDGDAVLIFPEGTSAAEGDLLPFRSGASRILLAARRAHIDVTVVALGLGYEARERAGAAVTVRLQHLAPARDLPDRPDDRVTTQTLTERLEAAVRMLSGPSAQPVERRAPAPHWRRELRRARRWPANAPMRLAHRIADRLPGSRAERATHHVVVGLGVLLASLAAAALPGVLLGRVGMALGLPCVWLGLVVQALATGPWSRDRRMAAVPHRDETAGDPTRAASGLRSCPS